MRFYVLTAYLKSALEAHYIYQDSKFLTPVVYSADLVSTSAWAVFATQHTQYNQFLLQTSQEGNVMYHYIREAKS